MQQADAHHHAGMRTGLATVGVLLASVGFGLVPFFARSLSEAGLAPYAIAFYRFVLAALLLFPVMARQWRAWRVLLWGIVSGVFMGLGWMGYVVAVEAAPVSTVGVLYMTYPVFTLGLAWALFGEVPSGRAMVAAGMVIAAAFLASSPAAVSVEQIPVLVVSLAAPFGFGLGISVLVHRLSRIPPLARIASVSFGSMLGLLPLVVVSAPETVIPGDREVWLLVAGIALFSALVPQLIYVVCSPVIGTARSAMAGSVELPVMFLVGWVMLGEVASVVQWLACGIVVAAIVITPTRVTRGVAVNLAREGRPG